MVYNYVIKFVSDLQQVGGTPVSSTIKTDRHDITEILLKVALNTINQTNQAKPMNIGSLGRGIGRSIQLNSVGVCTLISKQFDTYCTMTSILIKSFLCLKTLLLIQKYQGIRSK